MRKLKQKYIDAIDRALAGSGRALVAPWDQDGYDPEEGERVEIEGDTVFLTVWNFGCGSRRTELKLGTEHLAELHTQEEEERDMTFQVITDEQKLKLYGRALRGDVSHEQVDTTAYDFVYRVPRRPDIRLGTRLSARVVEALSIIAEGRARSVTLKRFPHGELFIKLWDDGTVRRHIPISGCGWNVERDVALERALVALKATMDD